MKSILLAGAMTLAVIGNAQAFGSGFGEQRPPAVLPTAWWWWDKDGWTQEQRLNAQNVLQALNARNEATRLSNLSGPGPAPIVEIQPIIANLRAALEHANAVNDDVLDKIHPEFKRNWKDKFIAGLCLRLSNLESAQGNLQAEIRGQALMDEYGDWQTKNKIRIPLPK
jgi:hypothetical protein